jgi:hypothetical protein
MVDTQGRYIPDDAPESYTYNPDGTIATITKTFNSESWVATFTWSGTEMTSFSGWVRQ